MTQLSLLAAAVVASLVALVAGAIAASGLSERAATVAAGAFALLVALALMLFGSAALRASLPG